MKRYYIGIALLLLLDIGLYYLFTWAANNPYRRPPQSLMMMEQLLFFINFLVLGHVFGYIITCLGLIYIAFKALSKHRQNIAPVLFALLLLGNLAIYMLKPLQPALGYVHSPLDYIYITQPLPWMHGLHKSQAGGEHKPCAYEILGWQQQTLFYKQDCWWQTETAIYQYNVNTNDHVEVREDFETETVSRTIVSSVAFAETIDYQGFPPTPIEIYISGDVVVDQDGEWAALVTKYLFSVEDVIIVKLPSQ